MTKLMEFARITKENEQKKDDERCKEEIQEICLSILAAHPDSIRRLTDKEFCGWKMPCEVVSNDSRIVIFEDVQLLTIVTEVLKQRCLFRIVGCGRASHIGRQIKKLSDLVWD